MVKERLYSGETCFGAFVGIGSPDIVDILKRLGFDWLLFDVEHSYVSIETVKTMVQAIGDKVSPIVRIGQVDQYLVKRALDIGSEGVLAPLINSPEEAERLVKFAMYPPKGIRGLGSSRAAGFGLSMSEYFQSANDQLLIGVQIETTEALTGANEILGTKGVDLGFVGPTDLTVSLGLGQDRTNPKVIESLQKVVKDCNKQGKIPGTMATSVEEAKKFQDIGFKFVALASDARFLISGARAFLSVKK